MQFFRDAHLLSVLFWALINIFIASCATYSKPSEQTIVLQGSTQGAEFDVGVGAGVWLDDELIAVDSVGFDLQSCRHDWVPHCIAYYNKNSMRMGVGVSRIRISPSLWALEHRVTVRKVGYKDQVLVLRRKLDYDFFYNAFNLIGFFVDLASGAMWEYTPTTAQLKFVPGTGSVKIGSPKIDQNRRSKL